MRLITWIVGMTVAVLSVSFAVSNREAVAITLWPFPFALDIGLYIVVLIGVIAGFLVGCLLTWVAGGKHRRRVRRQRAEIKSLEGELDTLRTRQNSAENKAVSKAA